MILLFYSTILFDESLYICISIICGGFDTIRKYVYLKSLPVRATTSESEDFLFIMEYYKNLDLADIVYFCEIDNIEKTEQWKDIIGYEKLYQVSDLGRVKSSGRMVVAKKNSLSFKKERIMKQAVDKGYLKCCLTHESKKFTAKIHRLVAIAFIPNPENKPEVNHIGLRPDGKQGNKSDNRAVSLQWNTLSENRKHADDNGLINYVKGENHYACKLTEKQVLEIRSLKGIKSERVLGVEYGVSRSVIHAILSRNRWKHI